MSDLDQRPEFAEARDWLGDRAGILYAALDNELMFTEDELKRSLDLSDDERAFLEKTREVIVEMMRPIALLLGILYPDEMQD